jgi:hypothetical protein
MPLKDEHRALILIIFKFTLPRARNQINLWLLRNELWHRLCPFFHFTIKMSKIICIADEVFSFELQIGEELK